MATIAEKLAEAAVTDSLNRAENPIGAPWVKINPGTSAGKCVSSAPVGYTPVTSFAAGEDDCYWSTSPFSSSSSQYIYAIFTLSRVGSTERQTGVWLCRDEAKPVETQNGYLLRLEKKAGANEIKYTIEKWVAGTPEVIKEFTSTSFIAGAKIALVVGNNKAYVFASTTEGGTFEEQISVETTTYTKGYSGMRAKGTGEFIIKDFRTGTFTLESGEPTRQFTTTPESNILATAGTCFAQGVHDRTVMMLVKSEGAEGNLLKFLNKAGEGKNWFPPQMFVNFSSFVAKVSWEGGEIKMPSGWALVGYSKEAGNKVPRGHVYDFSGKTWTHKQGNGVMQEEIGFGEGTTAWFKMQIGGKTGALTSMQMKVAAIVVWDSVLTDAQIEQLASAASIGAWASMSPAPKDLLLFNQGNVSEAIKGTVGTIEQLERLETSVSAEKPPIPYASLTKKIKLLVGGVIKEVARWVLVKGELVQK